MSKFGIICSFLSDGPDLSRWTKGVIERQLPFAMSIAVNKTATRVGRVMANKAKANFKMEGNLWAGKYKQLSFNGIASNTPAAWYSIPCKKRKNIDEIEATVGEASSLVAHQFQKTPITRTSHNAGMSHFNYLAIPLRGARATKGTGRRYDVPAASTLIRNAKKFSAFVIKGNAMWDSRNGIGSLTVSKDADVAILCIRKNGAVIPMYKLVLRQKIIPKFKFKPMVDGIMAKTYSDEFDKAMEYAVKTDRGY